MEGRGRKNIHSGFAKKMGSCWLEGAPSRAVAALADVPVVKVAHVSMAMITVVNGFFRKGFVQSCIP
jgi:hypothetical protein